MSRTIRALGFLLLILAAVVAPVYAQDAEFRLHAQRNFGYSSGSDIRGSFTLSIYGDEKTIQSVRFLMDGSEIATATKAPFIYRFQTAQYADGWHDLSADVKTVDGRLVSTPVLRLHFVTAAEESVTMRRILIPLVGGILLVMAVGILAQFLVLRRHPERLAPGAERVYGLKGGAICPRCGRAYPIHFWSVNLLGSYFDRCDYCGKWAVVRSRSRAELDAAVATERAAAEQSEHALYANGEDAEGEAERQKKLLDDSKYTE